MHPFPEYGNVSAFLVKLWKMVNDPTTDNIICWSPAGNTFTIKSEAQFWFKLLPLYYKHNNMSSFVRQLNMYGFHKITSLMNQGNPSESEEGQTTEFYHPYFQKNKPEKLKEIKRKGYRVPSKTGEGDSVVQPDNLNKVILDVKQLRGRQSSVDSQLSAMKQENAVLWRELAILRQKHVKQQQIVNKLIQFLVTMVQPNSTPRMGVGAKRRMPLMLHESPAKKPCTRKTSVQNNDSGPTIHELDPETDLLPEQLLEEASGIEDDIPLIDSPITPTSQEPRQPINSSSTATESLRQPMGKKSSLWDKPDFVTIEDVNDDVSDNEDDLMNTLQKNSVDPGEKVFLTPNSRDALIGNLLNPAPIAPSGTNIEKGVKMENEIKAEPNMQLAKKPSSVKIHSGEDLDLHVDSTQNELDQLKDILNGCNSLDANALLGLFSDDEPNEYSTRIEQNKELAEGPEVTPVSNLIDFNDLFDEDLTNEGGSEPVPPPSSSSLNTPVVVKSEPVFPKRK